MMFCKILFQAIKDVFKAILTEAQKLQIRVKQKKVFIIKSTIY